VWAGGQDVIAAGLAGGQQLPLAEVVSSLLEWRPLHDHIRYPFLSQARAQLLLFQDEGMTLQVVRYHVLWHMSQGPTWLLHMHTVHRGGLRGTLQCIRFTCVACVHIQTGQEHLCVN
jgi:uncharacterized iron-regulated membrane protein